jgi:hypothetical protein
MSANVYRPSVVVKRLAHVSKAYKVPNCTKTYVFTGKETAEADGSTLIVTL